MSIALAVSILAVIVSSFSCGYSVAMHLTSEYRIKELVEKRLETEFDQRCEQCQRNIGRDSAAIKNEDDITVLAQAMCGREQGDPEPSDRQSLGSEPGPHRQDQ